ncbi:MAG TPA: CDP-archaeol synthase [Kofleriaceae bacterium]|nr:CDP-archaeol synthase [Kofleriaceae bacterium]
MPDLAQAIWLVLPVLLAGATDAAIARAGLLRRLALPLDGGARVGGVRLFGDGKTLRGVVVVVVATSLWTVLQWWLHRIGAAPADLHPIDLDDVSARRAGALMGLGYALGELPTAAVKRQLGIAPGAAASGAARAIFWLVDQLDGAIGLILLLSLLWPPPLPIALWTFAVFLAVHPAIDRLRTASAS